MAKSKVEWVDERGQPTTFSTILAEAHTAAAAAQANMIENMNALDCGFAWVTIDGQHPLARWARAQAKRAPNDRLYGDKGYPRGWQWWEPGNFRGQSIGIHEAGARAFRDVLAKYNIVGTVGSRYD